MEPNLTNWLQQYDRIGWPFDLCHVCFPWNRCYDQADASLPGLLVQIDMTSPRQRPGMIRGLGRPAVGYQDLHRVLP